MGKDTPTANEVQEALGGLNYPAKKDKIVDTARKNEASDRVMHFLEQIPDGREFTQPTELSEELTEYSDTRPGEVT